MFLSRKDKTKRAKYRIIKNNENWEGNDGWEDFETVIREEYEEWWESMSEIYDGFVQEKV